MCSTRSPGKESYEFFENIEEYIEKAKSAESNTTSSNAERECDSFMTFSGHIFRVKERAKIICEQYTNLYDLLTDCKNKSGNNPNYNKCSEFLKYWVNFKLIESMKNEGHTVHHVYDLLEGQITSNVNNNINLNFICDINNEDLNKMNILYSLYENYSELKTIINTNPEEGKQKLLPLSSACCIDYIKANYICNDGNNIKNSKFCEKLNTFISKYKDLYTKVDNQGPEFSNNFIKLEECPNTKIITTAVTGTVVGLIPLLGVLYKFTPMGQVIRSKMGILNNDISNIDEDMTNISLMEQEKEPLKFQQGTYNIKYQSL
ncbi:PIR protein [Plasmodium vivax]|nr:PIR protein [Plasmodium vivax]